MIPAAGTDAPDWPDDAIEVGKIVDAWGIKGGIKVKPFASDPQALFSSKRWFLLPPERESAVAVPAAASGNVPRVLKVSRAQEHGDHIVATSLDVPDRTAAEALRGVRVFVSRSSFPTPDADEFYWIDLIGLRVVNRQAEELGVVEGLIETGPHCVLRVKAPGAPEECLIPFVSAYIDKVDLPSGRIEVDWGMDY
jgi:16S rRNA processing protein RimM